MSSEGVHMRIAIPSAASCKRRRAGGGGTYDEAEDKQRVHSHGPTIFALPHIAPLVFWIIWFAGQSFWRLWHQRLTRHDLEKWMPWGAGLGCAAPDVQLRREPSALHQKKGTHATRPNNSHPRAAHGAAMVKLRRMDPGKFGQTASGIWSVLCVQPDTRGYISTAPPSIAPQLRIAFNHATTLDRATSTTKKKKTTFVPLGAVPRPAKTRRSPPAEPLTHRPSLPPSLPQARGCFHRSATTRQTGLRPFAPSQSTRGLRATRISGRGGSCGGLSCRCGTALAVCWW